MDRTEKCEFYKYFDVKTCGCRDTTASFNGLVVLCHFELLMNAE